MFFSDGGVGAFEDIIDGIGMVFGNGVAVAFPFDGCGAFLRSGDIFCDFVNATFGKCASFVSQGAERATEFHCIGDDVGRGSGVEHGDGDDDGIDRIDVA